MKFKRKIKIAIASFLIEILRKMKVSVILGFEVTGTLKSKTFDNFYYDSDISGKIYLSNGEETQIPRNQSFQFENAFYETYSNNH